MTTERAAPERGATVDRVSTGHRELDEVLGGGFPAHSINIIMGPPGTGKTILAEQTLFHNAEGDRPVIYLSTLSEPLSKILAYLQNFSFYDEERMLGAVIYEDIGPDLLEHGVDHLLDRVRTLIREKQPKLLVVDSFKAVHDLASSPNEMRRLAAQLGGLLSASDVTTLLIGEYPTAAATDNAEFAVADGIVEMSRVRTDNRDDRHLRVLKLRGSAYREGLHAFRITKDGLRVYPRLISPSAPAAYSGGTDRVTTGAEGLDALLEGGFWGGTSALVVGPAGSGKTTFGLGFALEGARRGEPSLYVNFQENPTQLARSIRALGIDPEEYREKGLRLQYESPVELRIDAVVVKLFDTIRRDGIRRVVIDALGDLALAATSRERFHDYMYAMVQHFAVAGVTSVLTLEAYMGAAGFPQTDARYSTLSDALIELRLCPGETATGRTLRVVKARGIRHPLAALPMAIEGNGIRVLPEEGAHG